MVEPLKTPTGQHFDYGKVHSRKAKRHKLNNSHSLRVFENELLEHVPV